MSKTANDIYHSLGKGFSKEDLQQAIEDGMLAKDKLVSGHGYQGYCRNATLAFWNGNDFMYLRQKFGQLFPEHIPHPEDDNGYDIFVPMKEVE